MYSYIVFFVLFRKPTMLHGKFNYIPTRCRFIAENKQCPQGEQKCTKPASGKSNQQSLIDMLLRFEMVLQFCCFVVVIVFCLGVHCRFAHSTDEVIYHPSKYKTQGNKHQH
jgi:hypothetical protein